MNNITLEKVSAFARTLLAEKQRAAELQQAAAAQAARVTRIEDELMPNMLREIDMMSFVLGDGRTISVEPAIHASISEAGFPEAERWLQERQLDAIIKNQVILEFDRGENDNAEEMIDVLKVLMCDKSLREAVIAQCSASTAVQGVDAIAVIRKKKSIHPQTLLAFIREQMRQGVDIPETTFGIFINDHVKIK